MNNYESKNLIPMPEPKPYQKMTNKELQKLEKSLILQLAEYLSTLTISSVTLPCQVIVNCTQPPSSVT